VSPSPRNSFSPFLNLLLLLFFFFCLSRWKLFWFVPPPFFFVILTTPLNVGLCVESVHSVKPAQIHRFHLRLGYDALAACFLVMVNFIAVISLASEVGGARGRRDQILNTHHTHVTIFCCHYVVFLVPCAWLYKTEVGIVFLGKKRWDSTFFE
jgi:hypothetical protein